MADPTPGLVAELDQVLLDFSALDGPGLVGENLALDRLLLEVATVGRPAGTEQRVEEELRRLRTRDTAIEAARAFMVAHLRSERLFGQHEHSLDEAAAIQALRDCLFEESRARRGGR